MSTISDTTNNLYEIYVNNNISLVQSIVIKFDQIAQATNSLVLKNTGVLIDPSDRTKWKYYQNISGQYNFSDKPMSVYSLDSESIIPFTVASLAENPVTAQAYSYGSTFYNELLAAYPDQEMLILGILYPCNMTTAINAPDGTILSYPSFLVEDVEINFIDLLQSWIYAYINRWVVMQFCLTDDLYSATFFAQLLLNMVNVVANIRLAACKTNQAHSFHVKQYLRSHGFIDTYLNEMSQKQILNMYRNINYYERNAGFETTFNTLIDVLFTDIGFPVYKYVMEHRTDGMNHSSLEGSSVLNPTASFKRVPINAPAENINLPDYLLPDVLSAMSQATPNNQSYQNLNAVAIEEKLERSVSAKLSTKLIECALNPLVRTISDVPDEILFNQWVALSATNKYAVPIEYTPLGSIGAIRLNHQQALALWIYATHMAVTPTNPDTGFVPLIRVPPIRTSHVVLDPTPTLAGLSKYVDSKVITQDKLSLLLSTAVVIPSTVPSLVSFTKLCQSIYLANILQKLVYSFQEEPRARAQLQAAADGLYSDTVFILDSLQDPANPGEGITFTLLLEQVGLDLKGYQPVDYYNMSVSLFKAATGSGLNINADPANIQTSMISLMTYLSSYSLQFISSGSPTDIPVANQIDARVNSVVNTEATTLLANMSPMEVLSLSEKDSFNIEQPVDREILPAKFNITNSFFENIAIINAKDTIYTQKNVIVANIPTSVSVTVSDDQASLFAQLTPAQRLGLVDVYRN